MGPLAPWLNPNGKIAKTSNIITGFMLKQIKNKKAVMLIA